MFNKTIKNISKYRWCYKYVFPACTLYAIGQIDNKYIGRYCFEKGLFVSQKFKYIPMWDSIVEPFIVNQFGAIFIAGHSFIQGMISDNEDTYASENLEEISENIKNHLDNFTVDKATIIIEGSNSGEKLKKE